MSKVCNSSCPYYGVDENYNGFCKKNSNSRRERGSACNMDGGGAKRGSVCNSSCPYYGVDENDNGFCKKDHNSFRNRGSACNM